MLIDTVKYKMASFFNLFEESSPQKPVIVRDRT